MKTARYIAALLSLGFLLAGCQESPDYENYVYPPAESKADLDALITECATLLAESEEGTDQGQYLSFVMANFQKAVNESRTAQTNDKATQAMVDAAAKKLRDSRDVFLASVNSGPVDPNDSYLVLHMRFNGNFLDSSPLGHTAALHEGNSLCGNGPKPSLVADRNGDANSAVRLSRGGYIEFPFVDGTSEALNPEVMTFMCWIREPSPVQVQRWIFCLNTWNIFYVIMPADGNGIQFSGSTTRGWLPLYESGVQTSANWSHFAMTYSPEGVCFYKNGEFVSRADGMGNLTRNNARFPFFIGLMDPTRELYYDGELDEFRLYNKVLDASEVAAVFEMEKSASMVVDKSVLQSRITAAGTAKSGVTQGFAAGQYLARVIAAFQTQIDEATTLNANAAATQTQVDKGVTALNSAITAFQAAANKKTFDPNLVLDLQFAGNFADSSYMAFAPTLVNGTNSLPPLPAIDRYGSYDGACHVDKGSYLSIPYNTALNPAQLTYMCWVKAASPAGAGDPYLMSLSRRFGFYLGLSSGKFSYGGTSTSGTIPEISSGIAPGTGWKHVAVTYSAADGIKFYEDGTLRKSDTAPAALAMVATDDQMPFTIGVKGSADHTTTYFRGDVDEVRVYDRALSGSEVTAIYNAQKP